MTDEAGSQESHGSQGSQGTGAEEPQPGSQDTVAPAHAAPVPVDPPAAPIATAAAVPAAVPAASTASAAAAATSARERISAFLNPVFGGSADEAVKVSNLQAFRAEDVRKLIAGTEDHDKHASPLLARRLASILQQLGNADTDGINRFQGVADLIVLVSEQPADVAAIECTGAAASLSTAWQRLDTQWTELADAGQTHAKQRGAVAKLYDQLMHCARRLVGHSEGHVQEKLRDALIPPILRTVTNGTLSIGNRRIATEALFDIFDMSASSAATLKHVQSSLKDLGRSFASAGDFLCQGNLTEFVASLIRSDQIQLKDGGLAFCAGISAENEAEVFDKFEAIMHGDASNGRMLKLARPFIVFSNSVAKPQTVWSFQTDIKLLSKDETKFPHVTLGTVWLDCGREFVTILSDTAQREVAGKPTGDVGGVAVCFSFGDIQEVTRSKTIPNALSLKFVHDRPLAALVPTKLLSPEYHRDISVVFKPEDAARATQVINSALAADPDGSPSSPEPPAAKNDTPPNPKSPAAKTKFPVAKVDAPPKPQPSASKRSKGKGKGKGKTAKGKRKSAAPYAEADDEAAPEPQPKPVAEPAAVVAVPRMGKRATKEAESTQPAPPQPKTAMNPDKPPPQNGNLKAPEQKDGAAKSQTAGSKRKLVDVQPPKLASKPHEPPPVVVATARGRLTRSKKAAPAPSIVAVPEPPEPEVVVPESPEHAAAADEAEVAPAADDEPPTKKQKADTGPTAKAPVKPTAKPAKRTGKPKAKEPQSVNTPVPEDEDVEARGSDDEEMGAGDGEGDGDEEMQKLMAQVKRIGATKLEKKKREYDKLASKSFAKIESVLNEQMAAISADRERLQKQFEKELSGLKSEYSGLMNTTKALALTIAAQLQDLERADQKLKKRAASIAAVEPMEPADHAAKIKAAIAQCNEAATRMREAMFAVARGEHSAKLEKTLTRLIF